jgi:predicted TIM-barrel fold metal-dependent hydrolase
MLPEDVQIISVDDHVIEHPRVWTDRLPEQYKAVGPNIVRAPDGNDFWMYEGQEAGNFALNAVAGKDPRDFAQDPRSYDDMRRGCYKIEDRIADMDREGIRAQLCFPNMGGFAGRVFFQSKDRHLGELCVRAYNDFILEEWCAYNPQRQIPLVMLPFWDVQAAVTELNRTIEMGARSVTFPEQPHRLGLPSFHTDHWDPLFALAEEAEVPLSMHFGSGGGALGYPADAQHIVSTAMMGMNSMAATIDLILSRVFHQFPNLKVIMAEGGLGWIPYVLERCDYTWERHRWNNEINREIKPSQLFHKNVYGCFISDQHGIDNRYLIGVDNVLFESDYPHSDSQWPYTWEKLDHALEDVPEDESRKIVELNARRILRFPRLEIAA